MRAFEWKVLKQAYVYENKWFHARADRCELPDGRIIEPYFVVEVPNFCNVFIVTKEEKIVLVKQYRYPVDQITYELAGGVIENNEDPLKAAIREMTEETGYVSDEVEYLFKAAANPALMNNTAYYFLAKNATKINTQNLDALEDIDVVSFSKAAFLQMLSDNQLQHAAQLGAVYASMIKLGWLQWR